MRKIIILSILISILSIYGVNDDLFDIALQAASYKGMPGDTSYTEIYLSYARQDIEMVQNNDGSHEGAINISMTLMDSEENIIDSLSLKREIYVQPGISPENPYHLIELYPFALLSGNYKAVVIITDAADRKKQMSKKLNFTVDDYSVEEPRLSDIYLIGKVGMPDSSLFTKYNIKILPYPRAVYTPYFPMMKFTYELYNYEDSRLFLGIEDTNGNMIRKFREIDIPKEGVAFNEMNVTGLYEGDYDLVVKLSDQKGKDTDIKKRGFTVIKKKTQDRQKLSPEETDLLTRMMRFLLPTSEERAFDALNPETKYDYWKNYWARNDTTEGQKQKQAFLENWAYAAQAFETGEGRKDGYKTDMGKIYIEYGPPDYIERHPFTSETNAWEKWIYTGSDVDGEFIFGDKLNIGKMELLSSTVIGEYEDPNWQQKLNKQRRNR
ncbi:MAG: GWxTD domain-containing protein [Candidatus Zixiibacteriota bacterium]